jgi:NADPH-dependent curcumin reductase CurA
LRFHRPASTIEAEILTLPSAAGISDISGRLLPFLEELSMKNMQVLLAARPRGPVEESHFRIVESEIPEAGEGEFVVRNHYLSLDPYMRGRMDDAKSYAKSAEVGEVMVGTAVGEVTESRHEKFKPGDFVETRTGWQLYGKSDGGGARKIDPGYVPLSAYLGVVGMPGVTAWIGPQRARPAQAGRDRSWSQRQAAPSAAWSDSSRS